MINPEKAQREGTTRTITITRIICEARTIQDVATWLGAALNHAPNGTPLRTPVTLSIEVER